MKRILEWIDFEILDNIFTPIVCVVIMAVVEWLGKNRIPDVAIYAVNVALGLLSLVSAVKSWSGGIRIAAVVFFAFVMLASSVEIIKDLATAPTSAPQRSSQQYVESTPTRSTSGGQSGGSSGSSAYSGGSATGFSGWSGSSAKTCPICNGRKTCDVCGGLKSCQFTYGTNPCMNGKLRIDGQTFTCSSCNGSGKCKYCSGTGKCTYCDGTGTI